jgi:chloramphenicol O-acetyltransferase
MARTKYDVFKNIQYYEDILDSRQLQVKEMDLAINNLQAQFENKKQAEQLALNIELEELKVKAIKERNDLRSELEKEKASHKVAIEQMKSEVKAWESKKEALALLEAEQASHYEASAKLVSEAAAKQVQSANTRAEKAEEFVKLLIAKLPDVSFDGVNVNIDNENGKSVGGTCK